MRTTDINEILDYSDLSSALYYNGLEEWKEKIATMLAVIEGQNEGEAWHWVCKTKDKKYLYITGWCDYTGWDCQSGCKVTEFNTKWELKRHIKTLNETQRVYAEIGGRTDEQDGWADVVVADSLLSQIKNGRSQTWRERTRGEFE